MDVRSAFVHSLLSEASYADFDIAGSISQTDVENALIANRFSYIQVADFITRWRVADHQPNTPSGFSATIFESLLIPGEYVFAIRGTEPTAQLSTDIILADIADIGADGIALNQAVDLFNYYQRLTTQTDQLVTQYKVYEGDVAPPPGIEYIEYDDGNPFTGTQYRYLVTVDPAQGLEIIPDTVATFDIAGHSLGGHLALILSRLIHNRTSDVYTYNAPGFDTGLIGSNDTEWFFRAMAQAEYHASGMTTVGTSFTTTRLHNYVAPGDIFSEIGIIPGSITPHFSEGTDWLSAHSISNVVDAMAVCNLLSALDPGIDMTDCKPPLN